MSSSKIAIMGKIGAVGVLSVCMLSTFLETPMTQLSTKSNDVEKEADACTAKKILAYDIDGDGAYEYDRNDDGIVNESDKDASVTKNTGYTFIVTELMDSSAEVNEDNVKDGYWTNNSCWYETVSAAAPALKDPYNEVMKWYAREMIPEYLTENYGDTCGTVYYGKWKDKSGTVEGEEVEEDSEEDDEYQAEEYSELYEMSKAQTWYFHSNGGCKFEISRTTSPTYSDIVESLTIYTQAVNNVINSYTPDDAEIEEDPNDGVSSFEDVEGTSFDEKFDNALEYGEEYTNNDNVVSIDTFATDIEGAIGKSYMPSLIGNFINALGLSDDCFYNKGLFPADYDYWTVDIGEPETYTYTYYPKKTVCYDSNQATGACLDEGEEPDYDNPEEKTDGVIYYGSMELPIFYDFSSYKAEELQNVRDNQKQEILDNGGSDADVDEILTKITDDLKDKITQQADFYCVDFFMVNSSLLDSELNSLGITADLGSYNGFIEDNDVTQAVDEVIGSYRSQNSYHYSFHGGKHFDAVISNLDNDTTAEGFYSFGLDCTAGTIAILSRAIKNSGGDPSLYFGNLRGHLNNCYPVELSKYFTNMEQIYSVISLDDLQAGDILVYTHHMALYCGGGLQFDFGSNHTGGETKGGMADYSRLWTSGLVAVYRLKM